MIISISRHIHSFHAYCESFIFDNLIMFLTFFPKNKNLIKKTNVPIELDNFKHEVSQDIFVLKHLSTNSGYFYLLNV